jgi:hypothetical protein
MVLRSNNKYLVRITEIIIEKKIAKPTQSQCQVKRLSNVRYAQCVALGMKAHDSDHTDGTGRQGVKGSGKSQRGRKIKSAKYGGPNKYYPGSR